MALVFADQARGAYVDEPRTIVGSNLGYGKYRVFYDTINFSQNSTLTGDDVVIASLTQSATVWSLARLWATTATPATTTMQLGFVNKATGTFYPLSQAFDTTEINVPLTWDDAQPDTAADLPAVVEEVFSVEATRKGRESDAWLVFRTAGDEIDVGVVKFEVPVTVE